VAHAAEHVRLTIYLPAAEAEQLEQQAKANERSVTAEARLAIRSWLTLNTQTTTRKGRR
jgi:hypothetical protein